METALAEPRSYDRFATYGRTDRGLLQKGRSEKRALPSRNNNYSITQADLSLLFLLPLVVK